MRTLRKLELSPDGILEVEGKGRFELEAEPGRFGLLAAANRQLSKLDLQLDYAWFDRRDGGHYGHAVGIHERTAVWD